MSEPPYLKQERQSTCSLAVLRMVLGHFGIFVTESDLVEKVSKDYGKGFSNIWNPTIAKLACEYGFTTILSAEWPLLKEGVLYQAIEDYKKDPMNFNVIKYENPNDKDSLPEPLPLTYKEMFLAVKMGCKTEYGQLTKAKITALLNSEYLIQTSIKLQKMYPQSHTGFHSLLIYDLDGENVTYHDPYRGPAMACTVEHLLKATMDVGAFMSYKK